LYSYRFTAEHKLTYSFRTGFLTQLLALDVNQWTKIITKLRSDLLELNLLFFPIKLSSNEWSLFVIVAILHIRKKCLTTPMLCYFDPVGRNGDADITNTSVKIRQLFNVLWQNKFHSKVDKIENPFNKGSLSLRWFSGKKSASTFIK
jgi:hypothetical protein